MLQSLRVLYRLTPEKEALLPSPPLAFDSHCHIDQIRMGFRLARSANTHGKIQEICAKVPPDEHVVSLEGVVNSSCYTLKDVYQMWNRAQGYVGARRPDPIQCLMVSLASFAWRLAEDLSSQRLQVLGSLKQS